MEKQNQGSRERMESLAKGLGWFSIGLGLAEIAVPGRIARLIGVGDQQRTRALLRLCGVREIASGLGILSGQRTDGWMWSRVGGDLLDIATIGSAMGFKDTNRKKLATATAAVLGVTALDVYCGRELSQAPSTNGRISRRQTIIINRPPEEVYPFWRDLRNLPVCMDRLESVQVLDQKRSHWRVKGPAGVTLEWDSEITRDEPNRSISWRSVEGSQMHHAGSVRFEPATGRRGTLVILETEYTPPGGKIGAGIAKIFGAEPGQQVEKGLRRMKQILETGNIVRSESSIHPRMHPARPPAQSARCFDREKWRPHELPAEPFETPYAEETS